VYHISFLTLALGEKGVFNSYKKISKQRVFFTFPTILSRKLILSTENTTEQVNWYFSSAVVSSWKGLTFITRVFFPRYIVEHTKEVVRIAGYSIRAASFFLIVLYLILKTISLEQLTTERQGYKFITVYTCITFHFLH
jgi:hypothetical protein